MKTIITHICCVLALAFAATTLGAPVAYAASCNEKAAAIAAQQGGKVLSSRASGDTCKIKLLVKSPKGPPKRVTIVVPK